MNNLSGGVLIGIGCLLCFGSAVGGSLLALAIDQPDVLVTERVVEVEPSEPSRLPPPEDLDKLRVSYIERTGQEDEWTAVLVEELSGAICDGGLSADGLLDHLGPDIVLESPELDDFVNEVRSVCLKD